MTFRGVVHSHLSSITKLTWMMLLSLVLWQRATQGMPPLQQTLDCGPTISEYFGTCAHGELRVNMNRTMCNDRIVCYSNLGEPCQMYGAMSNCLPGLVCSCDRCREILTICPHVMRSPLYMVNRMKPIFSEYAFKK
ncbi:uncharacterized protein [Eurosta solidaginis]|uniref:uncharacterized protein n=1 Tax=Eurosta solidaginis TaxID=178769 RepID=UPI003531121D